MVLENLRHIAVPRAVAAASAAMRKKDQSLRVPGKRQCALESSSFQSNGNLAPPSIQSGLSAWDHLQPSLRITGILPIWLLASPARGIAEAAPLRPHPSTAKNPHRTARWRKSFSARRGKQGRPLPV